MHPDAQGASRAPRRLVSRRLFPRRLVPRPALALCLGSALLGTVVLGGCGQRNPQVHGAGQNNAPAVNSVQAGSGPTSGSSSATSSGSDLQSLQQFSDSLNVDTSDLQNDADNASADYEAQNPEVQP